VSWNVHGTPDAPRLGERLRAIARVVSARKPDLVLLQEVWRRRDAQAFEERLARKGYAVVPVPAGGVLMRGSGLLGFVRARAGWRASQPRFHEFAAEAPDWKLWEGDGLGDKGVQGFTLSRDDFTCEVLNTHLQAAYEPGGYAEVRRAQLAELRALAEAPEGRPVLVAGDLNTTPDEPAWQEVGALRDLTASAREACGCGTSVQPEESARWLDHLLAKLPDGWDVAAEVSLLRSQRPDVPYSDHHGLDAVLEITAPASAAPLAALAAARLAGPTTRRELLANAALWWLAR
jgi:endonuclease/exonuclease/phosphatase family metal-dependent hydrolase